MNYKDLRVTQVTPEKARNTCGPYWYLVTTGATSHTAFRTTEGFLGWLNERGLKLEDTLAEIGEFKTQRIIGEYNSVMHFSYDEFYNLSNQENFLGSTKTLSNGKCTLAFITEDQNGIRSIHTMNPNCEYRHVYEHADCRL